MMKFQVGDIIDWHGLQGTVLGFSTDKNKECMEVDFGIYKSWCMSDGRYLPQHKESSLKLIERPEKPLNPDGSINLMYTHPPVILNEDNIKCLFCKNEKEDSGHLFMDTPICDQCFKASKLAEEMRYIPREETDEIQPENSQKKKTRIFKECNYVFLNKIWNEWVTEDFKDFKGNIKNNLIENFIRWTGREFSLECDW